MTHHNRTPRCPFLIHLPAPEGGRQHAYQCKFLTGHTKPHDSIVLTLGERQQYAELLRVVPEAAEILPVDEGNKAPDTPLTLKRRQGNALNYLVRKNAPYTLIQIAVNAPEIPFADFLSAMAMSHHGTPPQSKEDWETLLSRAKDIRKNIEGNPAAYTPSPEIAPSPLGAHHAQ